MKHWFVAGVVLVVLLAAALRLPQLSLRPLHNDEGDNAIKFGELWTKNDYKYDPNEFHGPTLPYFTLPTAWLARSPDFNDFSESTFRTVTAFFGIGTVMVLLLLAPDLGRVETLGACLFAAISPAMVYYSRDYIHEMLLVFFTGLAAVAWWRFLKCGCLLWCVLAGAALGLMAATKETFVISVFALVLAVVCANGFKKWRCGFKPVGLAVGVAALTGVVFFTSFFSNMPGMLDAIRTYAPWLHRAGGASPHTHEWWFYFQRLIFYRANRGPVWSEGLILVLALAGFVAAMTGRGLGGANHLLVRVIAFYTGWMTLFYTLLPYKTPWCLIEFYYGMIVLAGIGTAVLVRFCKPGLLRGTFMALLAVGAAELACQAGRENFGFDKGGVPFCDTVKNPYVYSQTTPDIFRLLQTVDGLAKAAKGGYATPVEVISKESYWPLPWYLRRFTQIGYWDNIPDQPLAPIMIVGAELHAGFDERPARTHLMAGYYELRPNVFFELYVNISLWTKYIKTVPPEKD